MKLPFGFELVRGTKAATLAPVTQQGGLCSPVWPVRESFAGDWQTSGYRCEKWQTILTHPTVFACTALISSDISKLRPMLMRYDERAGIFREAKSPAFSPLLARPNNFQNRIDFLRQWITSLLVAGNTYVLKVRDARTVVKALYVLDPSRVLPLIASTGTDEGPAIFYELHQSNIADVPERVIVPASEIIHDKTNTLYHPLVGLSPLFGCGLSASIGLEIGRNSWRFFRQGSNPSGIVTIPGAVDPVRARAIKAAWADGFTGTNSGAVAVLADGAKFEALTMKSVDAETTNQIKATAEQVCSAFAVPAYMVGAAPAPSYSISISALNQIYFSTALQSRIEGIELCLTEGIGAADAGYSVQLDVSALLRMDPAQRIETNARAVTAGIKAPNEARAEEGLPPVTGGESPMVQQQQFSLAALARRDAQPDPFAAANNGAKSAPEEQVQAAMIERRARAVKALRRRMSA